jgi:hypothetical protein
MSVAIAAVLSSVAVMLILAGIPTSTQPVDTLLNVILTQRPLSANDASTALLYSVISYAMAFSASLFVLRFLGLFLAALGIPNEEQIRRNRELARQTRIQSELLRRQARQIAFYTTRGQRATVRRPVGTEPPQL